MKQALGQRGFGRAEFFLDGHGLLGEPASFRVAEPVGLPQGFHEQVQDLRLFEGVLRARRLHPREQRSGRHFGFLISPFLDEAANRLRGLATRLCLGDNDRQKHDQT